MPCRNVRGKEVRPWYPGHAEVAHMMHGFSKLWMFAWFAVVVSVGGCARNVQGVVTVHPTQGVSLAHVYGGATRLTLSAEEEPLLMALGGHSVVVDGRGGAQRVRVEHWRVLEGPHALPVWIGVLQLRGGELGLFDRNSDIFYYLEKESSKHLYSSIGRWAVVEGFVDGPHTVRVMYYDVLDPTTQDVSVSD